MNDTYPPDQVEEALVRCCKLKSIHPDEVTALKKLSKWPKPSLDVLTIILKQYESFQTADAKESSNKNKSKLLKGETQPLPKALFKQVSKEHPFSEKVI